MDCSGVVLLSAGSLYFAPHLGFCPLYHLLLLLISSIFLLPLLREALFMLCYSFLILSYCPLLLCFFFTPLVSKNPFWSSPASLDPVRMLSFLFPQKSSVLSQFLIPLLCSQCHWFYSHVSITHTSLLHVVVHIPVHIPCGLESQKLKAAACHTFCSMRLLLVCPPFLHLIREQAYSFDPLLLIYLTAMKYLIFFFFL